LVKVAIPQRRGTYEPMNATLLRLEAVISFGDLKNVTYSRNALAFAILKWKARAALTRIDHNSLKILRPWIKYSRENYGDR
jgi:hypothetical protein